MLVGPPLALDWAASQARAFGRRGDQHAFEVWLSSQTSDLLEWNRLRAEFNRAREEQEAPPAWKAVFRQGILPQVTSKGLQGLAGALKRDDPRICQGTTSIPAALQCNSREPVLCCCVLSWLILDGKKPHAVSVGPLDERFALACFKADQLCGYPGAIGAFLTWVDETPRETMRRELGVEVNLALIGRMPESSTTGPSALGAETPLATLLRRSIEAVMAADTAAM